MALAPRVVVVHRRTELTELLARHGTRGQAAFFLATRERRIEEVEQRHQRMETAIQTVEAAIPVDWRRGRVERADLAQFLFSAEDVVVVVGQDGLVANVAKYLDGQPVVGIDPEPGRNAGVLVRHRPDDAAVLLAATGAGSVVTEPRTMVEAVLDDGQRITALNELYLGHASHQTSRYVLESAQGRERQASSGLIVATGTGATGWCRSAWLERHSRLRLPGPVETALAWFAREAWPSPVTGTALTEGLLEGERLQISVESDRLVVFGDGVESDHLELSWGQRVSLQRSSRTLHLVSAPSPTRGDS